MATPWSIHDIQGDDNDDYDDQEYIPDNNDGFNINYNQSIPSLGSEVDSYDGGVQESFNVKQSFYAFEPEDKAHVAGDSPAHPENFASCEAKFSGCAVSAVGDIFIVDRVERCVNVYNQYGVRQRQIGKHKLTAPWDVTLTSDPKVKVVVSDLGENDLKVFSRSGKFLLSSKPALHLLQPSGVAYHGVTKELAVCDMESNCVFVHDANGKVKNVIPAQLPMHVCFDTQANVYVADSKSQTLSAYTPDNELIFKKEVSDTMEGTDADPFDITSDPTSGYIFQTDQINHQILIYEKTGKLKTAVSTYDTQMISTQALTTTPDGHLVAVDGFSGLVNVYEYKHLVIEQSGKSRGEGTETREDSTDMFNMHKGMLPPAEEFDIT